VIESFFYDSDFYTNTFTFGATLGAPHFHNCLMGNVTFGATGQKCYVVTPTNRNSDHGSAQPFTLVWPSSDAGNKAYMDGVASYLAPTLTNGTEVTMS
jgi:hypothetical protein